jgi:hypothetical protein
MNEKTSARMVICPGALLVSLMRADCVFMVNQAILAPVFFKPFGRVKRFIQLSSDDRLIHHDTSTTKNNV